jgi:uncharacterized protein
MPILINLRQLDRHNLKLEGELPLEELDLEKVDELIHAQEPLHYEVEAQKLDESVLVQGRLDLALNCECVRCLKPFSQSIELKDWACLLPLEGEDKALITNDCVDLTPYIREDILLEFPRHPLCKSDCKGLTGKTVVKTKKTGAAGQTKSNASAWAELNKLKF